MLDILTSRNAADFEKGKNEDLFLTFLKYSYGYLNSTDNSDKNI